MVSIAEQNSFLHDHTSAQETSSGGAIQSTATYKALRSEIVRANRALEGSQKDHSASHLYYGDKLDQMAKYIDYEREQPEIDAAPTRENPPSHTARYPVGFFRGCIQISSRPAPRLIATILDNALGILGRMRDTNTILSTRMAEVEEWSSKHMIYALRERGPAGNEALGEDIARFRATVGLSHAGYPDPGKDARKRNWGKFIVDTKPSRSDEKALPATWARMDQLCKGAMVFPTSLPNFEYIQSTSHGHWPEVVLAIYSWSFYKIHDSTFDATSESQEFLADLYRIWWESGEDFAHRFFEGNDEETYKATYARSEPIARPYAFVERSAP